MGIPLIDKIEPKNNGNFPLVDAKDVQMPDGKRLDEFAETVGASIQFCKAVTQEEYDAIVAAGQYDPTIAYLIVGAGVW